MGHNHVVTIDLEKLEWFRRNSRVGLTKNGEWTYNDLVVENARVQRLFHRGLRMNEAGEAQLHVGRQWCYLETVEDTLFFVENLRVENDTVILRLMDNTNETLKLDTLTHSEEQLLYCVLQNGQRARFLRHATATISPFLEQSNREYGLRLGGDLFPIRKE
jgi:hypothetical protein